MKNFLLILILLFIIVGCTPKNKSNNTSIKDSEEVISSMKVTINDKQYTIILEDNETARSFYNILPKEFEMTELNGNEKYVYLDTILPTKSSNPKRIKKGDLMLYGNNCLVLFYKSFETSYSYTKIGHIDNLDELDDYNITAKFEK